MYVFVFKQTYPSDMVAKGRLAERGPNRHPLIIAESNGSSFSDSAITLAHEKPSMVSSVISWWGEIFAIFNGSPQEALRCIYN